MRDACNHILSFILLVNLAGLIFTYTIEPVSFEILDNKFRLSIPNDPDIKWVTFQVNINKEFEGFEFGQLNGTTSMPKNRKWSYVFDRELKDTDIVYVWLALQYNRIVFRDKSDPISVEAYRRGDPNYKFPVTTTKTVTSARVDVPVTVSPPKPVDGEQKNKNCPETITEVTKSFGGPFCSGDLLFSDDFDTINANYWINEIRVPPGNYDAEYVLYNGTLGVDKGILKIEASLNKKDLKKDYIDLGARCTSSNVEKECSVYPEGVLTLPPIISGRLSTRNYFNFKYGRVEVRAKMPIGDWLFPLISLEPTARLYGDRYKSGEMRIAYTHGNFELMWQGTNINGGRLFAGVILNNNADSRYEFMRNVTIPNVEHFGDDFHTYSLTWKSDELILTVDDTEYGRIKINFKEKIKQPVWSKGGSNAPLDQMFHITLGLAAGGNGDFPNTEGKPWNNTDPHGSYKFFDKRSKWFPSWFQPTLEVDYVKVYAV